MVWGMDMVERLWKRVEKLTGQEPWPVDRAAGLASTEHDEV